MCRTASFPSQTELDVADAYYLGGHVYVISDAEAVALVACGYTVVDLFLGLESGDSLITEGGDSLMPEYA